MFLTEDIKVVEEFMGEKDISYRIPLEDRDEIGFQIFDNYEAFIYYSDNSFTVGVGTTKDKLKTFNRFPEFENEMAKIGRKRADFTKINEVVDDTLKVLIGLRIKKQSAIRRKQKAKKEFIDWFAD